MTTREPFDERDRALVASSLKERGRVLVDPFGADAHPDDMFFAPSLLVAQQQMSEAFANARADGTPFRVYPVFVERGFPNAFARDLGTAHVVGIHSGMATVAYELSAFLFAQPDFLPEIGDPKLEASPELPTNAHLGFWIADRISDRGAGTEPIGLELLPKDQTRSLMAHFLAHLMLRFAWHHELFHCLNGHCGLLRANSVSAELHEMEDDAELALSDEDGDKDIAGLPEARARHAMEIDADRSAVWAMLQLQMSDEEPFELLREKPVAVRLKLTMIGAILTVFLFEQLARRREAASLGVHPLPRDRMTNLFTTAGGIRGDIDDAVTFAVSTMWELAKRVPALSPLRELIGGKAWDGEAEHELAKLRQALTATRFTANPKASIETRSYGSREDVPAEWSGATGAPQACTR